MSQDYKLCSKSTVFIPRVHFMFEEYSLLPKKAHYVPIVQFIFQSTVYFATVQSMSHNYSLCAMITVYVTKITVYVLRVHVMS